MHFIHSWGFSFVEETCGKKMRAPLLGLPKPIYYLDIIRLTDLWEFFVAYSLSNNRKVEHFLCDAPLFTGNH